MKQITIISGKGGTGKTSITSGFAALSKNAVIADCDVDAADLHLILKPEVKKTQGFNGLKLAKIDKDKCTLCRKCIDVCNFDAINKDVSIIKEACEGCGVCELVCPVNAIELVERKSGFSYISETRFGELSHAKLSPGEEASGKLVTVVRENAIDIAEAKNRDLIIIDGPPGIGCPVIASISGVDLVLIVTEPTLSAIHDLERILGVAKHFEIPAIVCINKFDINSENSQNIEEYCNKKGVEIVGKIPYDEIFVKSMIEEKAITEFPEEKTSKKIEEMWKKVLANLQK